MSVERYLHPLVRPLPAWRAALCGALATLGGLSGLVAVLGFYGEAVASQSLLANLSLHAAAVALVVAGLLAIAGWRLLGALGVAASLLVASAHLQRIRWTPVAPVADAVGRLEVLHVNVLAQNRSPAAMARMIVDSGAEVVAVLEAEGVQSELATLDAAYPYRVGCDAAYCDTMLLSQRPLERPRIAKLPLAQQRLIVATVRVAGRPVRIAAVHFVKDFFAGMRNSQAWAVHRAVRESLPRDTRGAAAPLVVMGDFNATPWDPTVRLATRILDVRHPATFLGTWPTALGWLGFPIDHVLVSDHLRIERIAPTPATGSNHFGLRARLALTP